MKTHPITDHVPESELTAITPEGAARWLTAHAWLLLWDRHGSTRWASGISPMQRISTPTAGVVDYAEMMATAVERVAFVYGKSPRTIIAEMQADSRIAAECARMAGKKKETA